jgi:hypothetical protein
VQLGAAATTVSITPRPPYRILVSLSEGAPALLSLPHTSHATSAPDTCNGDSATKAGDEHEKERVLQQVAVPMLLESDVNAAASAAGKVFAGIARFSTTGDMIIVGYAKGGLITVLDTNSLRFLDVVKVR